MDRPLKETRKQRKKRAELNSNLIDIKFNVNIFIKSIIIACRKKSQRVLEIYNLNSLSSPKSVNFDIGKVSFKLDVCSV